MPCPFLIRKISLLIAFGAKFWKHSRQEYLNIFKHRNKWSVSSNPIAVGTIVLLKGDQTAPLHVHLVAF